MSKQDQSVGEIKSTCSDDGMKHLSGFFALLFKVYCRMQKIDVSRLSDNRDLIVKK